MEAKCNVKRPWTMEEGKKLFEYINSNNYDHNKITIKEWDNLSKTLGFQNRNGYELKQHYIDILNLKNFYDSNNIENKVTLILQKKIKDGDINYVTLKEKFPELSNFSGMVFGFRKKNAECGGSTHDL